MTSRPAPTIVVVAFNRPASLRRILASVDQATYLTGVRLVLSLDQSGCAAGAEVRQIAEEFAWQYGEKRIIAHPERLGLRRHILACGDLTEEYGDVIVLEDDLYVSPHFYSFAQGAAAFYANDNRVAGISLYHYKINEFTGLSFSPSEDGSDTYFVQIASSWGQMWSAGQWRGFRAWYNKHAAEGIPLQRGYPLQLSAWRESSWKKYFIRYLVETGRYFAFPRVSLSTNFAAAGTHTKRDVTTHQVPLLLGPRDWRLAALDESGAVYDAHFEMAPALLRARNPELRNVDFALDLFGDKRLDLLTAPYVLSARSCSRPIASFGLDLLPIEDNIALGIPGNVLHLGRREDFGRMEERTRRQMVKHVNREAFWAKYAFSLLKPVQTRLKMLLGERPRGVMGKAL